MAAHDPRTTNGRKHVQAGERQEGPGTSAEAVRHPNNDPTGKRVRSQAARGKRTTSRKDKELNHYIDGYTIKRDSHTPFNTSGGFCDVFLGRHPIYHKVVMKRPRMTVDGSDRDIKHFRTEAEIWSKLRHPNILQFIGMIEAENDIWLVSPFAANGSLPAYIKAHPETDREKLILQLIHAIEYLHHQNVVHGDIKGANVLISENIDVLLCDFGLSKFQDMKTVTSLRGAGTMNWSAPELLLDDDAVKTAASDVYAFGMTVYQILSGNIPFNGYSPLALALALKADERPPKEPTVSLSGISYAVLWEVAEDSWATEASERPTMADIRKRFRTSVFVDEDSSSSEATHSDHGSDEFSESQDEIVRSSNALLTHAEDLPTPSLSQPLEPVEPRVAESSSTLEIAHTSQLSLGNPPDIPEDERTIRPRVMTQRTDRTLQTELNSQEVVADVSDRESKRQLAIKAVIDAEIDFVREMEYLRDVSMKMLKTSDIIPKARRIYFVRQVFWNLDEIIAVNTRLRDALIKRQTLAVIVDAIGDIFLEVVEEFQPFLKYSGHSCFGQWELEKERNSNPAFAQFLKDTEQTLGSRAPDLNSNLTKPATHLVQYLFLLEDVLRYTPGSHVDEVHIPRVTMTIRAFVARVRGENERRLKLLQIQQRLEKAPGYQWMFNLDLGDDKRKLLHAGRLANASDDRKGFSQVFLFDHALSIVRVWSDEGSPHISLSRPLEFVTVSAETSTRSNSRASRHPITFGHLAVELPDFTRWANTDLEQKKWVDLIQKQQEVVWQRRIIFRTTVLYSPNWEFRCSVYNAVPFNLGKKIAYATTDGVYVGDLRATDCKLVLALQADDFRYVDVLDECGLLVVLSGWPECTLMTFPVDVLNNTHPNSGLKRVNKVIGGLSDSSVFKAGVCRGRRLVCVTDKNQPRGGYTIAALEPTTTGGNITLRVFKVIHIANRPLSIYFLEKKLCVIYEEGFDIIDMETLNTQKLPNLADRSLSFVLKEPSLKPRAIYQIGDEFLLCYNKFAFYVDQNGRRARPELIMRYQGVVNSFALRYTFILAFHKDFIDIRHVETGQPVQVIRELLPRCLCADLQPMSAHSDSTRSSTGDGDPGSLPPPPPAIYTRHEIIYKTLYDEIKILRLPRDSLAI